MVLKRKRGDEWVVVNPSSSSPPKPAASSTSANPSASSSIATRPTRTTRSTTSKPSITATVSSSSASKEVIDIPSPPPAKKSRISGTRGRTASKTTATPIDLESSPTKSSPTHHPMFGGGSLVAGGVNPYASSFSSQPRPGGYVPPPGYSTVSTSSSKAVSSSQTTVYLPPPTFSQASSSKPSMSASQPSMSASQPTASSQPTPSQSKKPSTSTSTSTRRRKKAGGGEGSEAPLEKRLARFKPSCPANILDRLERVRTQTFFLLDRSRTNTGPSPSSEFQNSANGLREEFQNSSNAPSEEFQNSANAQREEFQNSANAQREEFQNSANGLREEFQISGSTGNVYTVVVDKVPSCTCPDAGKGNRCKHVLFVFTKVLQVSKESGLWYQKALLTSELAQIFANAPAAPNAPTNPRMREALLRVQGRSWGTTQGDKEKEKDSQQVHQEQEEQQKKRRPEEGDDCPICYDTMFGVAEKNLVWCEGCGNAVHGGCFGQWSSTARAAGKSVTCVWCRSNWIGLGAAGGAGGSGSGIGVGRAQGPGGVRMGSGSASGSASGSGSGGYLNLANVGGLSPVRDTSTYYHGPRRGQRYFGSQYYEDD